MGRGAATERWIVSGAAALTGDPDGPCLLPPESMIRRVEHIGARLEADALGPLIERAAIAGFTRGGTASCGGTTRLLATRDGWLAVSLARPDDVALLPAWLEEPVDEDDPWPALTEAFVHWDASELVARGRPLGLPVARVGEVAGRADHGVRAQALG